MILASLIINIVVLVPVCLGLLLQRSDMDQVFGERSTAREILLSIYLVILVSSTYLLFNYQTTTTFVLALLSGQVGYKVVSFVLIKNKKTPVLWFNLFIALFHSATLLTL